LSLQAIPKDNFWPLSKRTRTSSQTKRSDRNGRELSSNSLHRSISWNRLSNNHKIKQLTSSIQMSNPRSNARLSRLKVTCKSKLLRIAQPISEVNEKADL